MSLISHRLHLLQASALIKSPRWLRLRAQISRLLSWSLRQDLLLLLLVQPLLFKELLLQLLELMLFCHVILWLLLFLVQVSYIVICLLYFHLILFLFILRPSLILLHLLISFHVLWVLLILLGCLLLQHLGLMLWLDLSWNTCCCLLLILGLHHEIVLLLLLLLELLTFCLLWSWVLHSTLRIKQIQISIGFPRTIIFFSDFLYLLISLQFSMNFAYVWHVYRIMEHLLLLAVALLR